MPKKTHPSDALALAFTAGIVAFVGAIVVLTIPYAIFTVPLPSPVNPVGLSVEATPDPLFGHIWYLLVPSSLFAVWVGYKFYQWGHKNAEVSVDDKES